ncbi:hypothetical protein HZA97_03675 [Candidatus Woesearchaeota archaeon]|nr:hypothetical protein [Candidatus Woesearchaeota archaeon]
MALKLEITKDLESLGDRLESSDLVAILNLPDANLCNKRKEFVLRDGKLEQACRGCVTQSIKVGEMITIEQIKEVINHFRDNYGTRWITINGRGDPFHPKLRGRTLEKIKHAASKGIRSYVFTAGNELDDEVCYILAENEVNVMISLYGNDFIDESFFEGKKYTSPVDMLKLLLASNTPEKAIRFRERGLIQDEARIAENLQRLIYTYQSYSTHTAEGVTRIAMNYVVMPRDLADNGNKMSKLKKAANEKGIAFFCNLEFDAVEKYNSETITQLKQLKEKHSTSEHSTSVNGQCQMGAGSSTTIDYNGDMYRCPYMTGGGDGNFFKIDEQKRHETIDSHVRNRKDSCGMRNTPRKEW